MADWADRPEVQGWMLCNLMQSLRALGNDAEANRVSRFAVALPRDSTTSAHQLWLILDDLFAGPCPDAAERIGRLDRSTLKHADDQYLLGLATLLNSLRQSPSESRRSAVSSAGGEIAALGRRSPIPRPLYPILRGCYHRAITLISKEKAGLPGRLWWLWRRLNPPVRRT